MNVAERDLPGADAERAQHEKPASPPQWAWMVLLAGLTAFFFLLFFNRFAGLRSGDGEFTTGIWFLRGQLPYRDYFSATPPLNTLKSALLLKVFGQALIVNRTAGVVERIAIALLLFQWLRRLFADRFAFAASLTTVIVSAGDMVDPIASYNHDTILWAVLSGFAGSRALESQSRSAVRGWAVAGGIAGGLCLMTKQTIGLGAVVLVPLLVFFLFVNQRALRRGGEWILGFYAGCLLPLAGMALWLHHLGVWMRFLSMAFLQGPAAKGGGVGDFLLRDAMVTWNNWYLVFPAVLAAALAWSKILRSRQGVGEVEAASSGDAFARLGMGFGLVMALATAVGLSRLGAVHNFSKIAIYFVLILTPLLSVGACLRLLRRRLSPREIQFCLLSVVSFLIAAFLSLSWPAFEAMTLPGSGFLIAAALDGSGRRLRPWVYGLLGILVFLQICEKLNLPFGFGGLAEAPVREARYASSVPELRGMRFSTDTNEFIEGTLKTIASRTQPGDTIFTYPEMSVFYALSGRGYPTLAGSHNVDVVNDSFAAEESDRLLKGRPAIVIYMPLTADEVRNEDRVWRFGKPSGQHKLVQAVETLIQNYEVAGVYRVGPERRAIVVYARK